MKPFLEKIQYFAPNVPVNVRWLCGKSAKYPPHYHPEYEFHFVKSVLTNMPTFTALSANRPVWPLSSTVNFINRTEKYDCICQTFQNLLAIIWFFRQTYFKYEYDNSGTTVFYPAGMLAGGSPPYPLSLVHKK
jgi:hypothetical protein